MSLAETPFSLSLMHPIVSQALSDEKLMTLRLINVGLTSTYFVRLCKVDIESLLLQSCCKAMDLLSLEEPQEELGQEELLMLFMIMTSIALLGSILTLCVFKTYLGTFLKSTIFSPVGVKLHLH